jgi:hypothetical protein
MTENNFNLLLNNIGKEFQLDKHDYVESNVDSKKITVVLFSDNIIFYEVTMFRDGDHFSQEQIPVNEVASFIN